MPRYVSWLSTYGKYSIRKDTLLCQRIHAGISPALGDMPPDQRHQRNRRETQRDSHYFSSRDAYLMTGQRPASAAADSHRDAPLKTMINSMTASSGRPLNAVVGQGRDVVTGGGPGDTRHAATSTIA